MGVFSPLSYVCWSGVYRGGFLRRALAVSQGKSRAISTKLE